MPEMKKLWVRAGGYITITDEEADGLMASEEPTVNLDEIIARNLREGTFVLDGDSYFPGESVQEFNENYGTDYDSDF